MSGKLADVAILTPIAEEWHAVTGLLDGPTRPGSDQTLPSREGWIGSHRVVCVLCGKGEGNTAAAVQFASQYWQPRWLFIVGIAGGFPEQKVHKGDLVIAQFVYDFEFGKLKDGVFVRRPEYDYACDRSLLGHAEILATNKARPWLSFITALRPDGVPIKDMRVHLGYLASSNRVVDDPTVEMYAAVKAGIPEVHAVEMEASGAGAAVRLELSRRTLGILVVRGISDVPGLGTGSEERAAWKEYAASTAAAFTKALLLSTSSASSDSTETSIGPGATNHVVTEHPKRAVLHISDPAAVPLAGADVATVRRYCEEYLSSLGSNRSTAELLGAASARAFQHLLGRDGNAEDQADARLLALITAQEAIQHFLVANHVVTLIRQAARGHRDALESMRQALPASITAYLKQMMSCDPRVEFSILNATRSAADHEDLPSLLNLYYLLGRVQDEEARHGAQTLLTDAKATLLRRAADMATTRGATRGQGSPTGAASYEATLWVLRTVYVSLIMLGESSASDEYIDHLLDDADWRNLNTGFHLEYYGDYPYEQPKHDIAWFGDLGGSFVHTAAKLGERIRKSLAGREYPLRDLEVFTLASLAQVRQSSGILADDVRENIRSMLDNIIAAGVIKHSRLLKVLKVIRTHLRQPHYAIAEIAEKLYKMKSRARTGLGISAMQRTESIADHALGAFLIGFIYLPDRNEQWPGYDKSTVLQILLMHDLSEALVSDHAVVEHEGIGRTERDAIDYLGGLATYPGLYGIRELTELATAFERGADFNARVAQDLDRVENLFQLWLYEESGLAIPEVDSFRTELMQRITTEPGQRILEIVRDRFENPLRTTAAIRNEPPTHETTA